MLLLLAALCVFAGLVLFMKKTSMPAIAMCAVIFLALPAKSDAQFRFRTGIGVNVLASPVVPIGQNFAFQSQVLAQPFAAQGFAQPFAAQGFAQPLVVQQPLFVPQFAPISSGFAFGRLGGFGVGFGGFGLGINRGFVFRNPGVFRGPVGFNRGVGAVNVNVRRGVFRR